jgi:hypothetical protein
MYTHAHAHTHTFIHIHTYTHIHTHTHVHTQIDNTACHADDAASTQTECAHQRPKLWGSALLIFEADGVVCDLGAGLNDDWMRVLRDTALKCNAQLVLASEWRADKRMLRMLNAVAKRIEMQQIEATTPDSTGGDGGAEHVCKEQTRIDDILALVHACSPRYWYSACAHTCLSVCKRFSCLRVQKPTWYLDAQMQAWMLVRALKMSRKIDVTPCCSVLVFLLFV